MAHEMINDDVRICVDCHMDHHEGRAMKDGSVDWTDNNMDEDGEDLTDDFSSSQCACCGSTLAGARFRYAIWEL